MAAALAAWIFGLAKLLQPLCREKYVAVFDLPSVLGSMQDRDCRVAVLDKTTDRVLLMVRHKVHFSACSQPPRSWVLLCCSVCWRGWVHGAEISTSLGEVKRWLLQGWAYHCTASAFSMVCLYCFHGMLLCKTPGHLCGSDSWLSHHGPKNCLPVNSLCLGSVAISKPLVLIHLYLRMSIILK